MAGADSPPTQPHAGSSDRDLELAVEKLEAQLEQVYRPLLKERVPELEAEINAKDEEIATLRSQVEELEARVESLVGVPEADASTHKKRVQDTKQILQRRASANDDGRASMYWREIAASLAEHGHGDLYTMQVKRLMDDVADAEGYALASGRRDVSQSDDRSDVREVDVVQCDLDDVPGLGPNNNVVSGRGEGAASQNPAAEEHPENQT